MQDDEVLWLSADDQQLFADALLNPPPLAPALLRAITHHHALIAELRCDDAAHGSGPR